jgi:hypothetical protein
MLPLTRTSVSSLIVALFALCLCAPAALAAAPAESAATPEENARIERLISAVENLKDATFVRNGTDYDGKAAADHMRRKWKIVAKDVKTARDFIRLVGTKSSQSDKPYVIRFKDGKEIESAKFLSEQLEKLEKPAEGGK